MNGALGTVDIARSAIPSKSGTIQNSPTSCKDLKQELERVQAQAQCRQTHHQSRGRLTTSSEIDIRRRQECIHDDDDNHKMCKHLVPENLARETLTDCQGDRLPRVR